MDHRRRAGQLPWRLPPRAVLATTRDATTPGEFEDVLSQLGKDYARLLRTTG